ncbi:PREDICTED: serine protease inhibitor Kazal-type 14 [Rhinopithecus bieti]|uniref:Serine peptidase inhibitor Kazal type 14 (putative) n=1 Tax=Rhinopithecus bieti TaxID=61621 RepID=A0A2K6JMX6_RHIBE|nr:PREDICTED: serine protease inhibitor Kazal-type 14 [Rhinopithecus bieti]
MEEQLNVVLGQTPETADTILWEHQSKDTPGGKTAGSFLVFSLLSFVLIHLVLSSVSGPRHWWPPHGIIKVKCLYEKVKLSCYNGTVNPCPGLYQPICGTNFITYDNPCILCVESLKSHGRIRFYHDGKC